MKKSTKGQSQFLNRCEDTMPKILTKEERVAFNKKVHAETEGRDFEKTIKCASNDLLFISHDNFKSDFIKNEIIVDEINKRLFLKREKDICYLDYLTEPK